MEHLNVDEATITRSFRAGKRVIERCSKTLKTITYELEGNDAAVVCADVDPAAIHTISAMAMENAGQICFAIKRLYINDDM
ncbi:hypothetical protein F4804DRAFT_318434 [Jackrogersella minutella]|nr:hypothetical protein F4804DRAFT_318434 [Jackrogersella minutella]